MCLVCMWVLCILIFVWCMCCICLVCVWCPWVTLFRAYMCVLQYISTTPLCLVCAWLWCVFDGWLVCGCGMWVWGESTQAFFCPFACFWLCLWSKGWRDQKSEDVAVVLMSDMRVRGLRWQCHIVFMLVKIKYFFILNVIITVIL